MTLRPTLTLPEAARLAGMSRRGLLRWLKARAHLEPQVLHRAEGERIWYVQREALKRLLGATEDDLRAVVEEHGRRLDDHGRRIVRLERQRTAGQGA